MFVKFSNLLIALAWSSVILSPAFAGPPELRSVADASPDSEFLRGTRSSEAAVRTDCDLESSIDSVASPKSSILNGLPKPSHLPVADQGRTLDEFLQLALADHPSLAAARSRVCEEKGTWLQVGLRPNPVLGYSAQEVGNEDGWGQHSLYLQKTFVQGNKLELNRSVASHDVDRARREYAATEMRILNDIKVAFYSALIAQTRREVSNKLADLAGESVRTAELLYQAEELTRISLMQSKTQQSTAKLSAMASATQETGLKRELAATVGNPEAIIEGLVGDALQALPLHDWESARERLLDCPQLMIQLARIDKARSVLARAQAEKIPNLSVQAGVLFDDATNHTAANFSVSRPLLVHDCNQGNLRRAAAELATAEHELDRTMLQLERDLAIVFRTYHVSRQQVDSYVAEILPGSRETLELVTIGFQAGEVDYLTLLTTQRTYVETYLNFLNALQSAWQASVRIDGCLLSGSLPMSN